MTEKKEESKEEKNKKAINSTGFIVEHQVSQILENNGWSVINNRYYIDDMENKLREIDLLAYKTVNFDKIRYFFVLVISCKKSETDDWVLITKTYKDDVNFTKFPFHYWTKDKILEKRIEENDFALNYTHFIQGNETAQEICDYEKNIFAFQQIDLKTRKKHNDADIYNSIISLIKATEYEIKILPNRKNN